MYSLCALRYGWPGPVLEYSAGISADVVGSTYVGPSLPQTGQDLGDLEDPCLPSSPFSFGSPCNGSIQYSVQLSSL